MVTWKRHYRGGPAHVFGPLPGEPKRTARCFERLEAVAVPRCARMDRIGVDIEDYVEADVEGAPDEPRCSRCLRYLAQHRRTLRALGPAPDAPRP